MGIAVLTALLFDACTVTRSVRQAKTRNDFFSPIRARAPRITQQPKQTGDPNLAAQLALLRDSLATVTEMLQYLQSRLADIEYSQSNVASKQSSLERQLEYAQSENRRLSQELSELRSKSLAYREPLPEKKTMMPARHSSDITLDYEGALGLFMSRQYERAIDSFQSLLQLEIPEELADNCEYWTGESYFAKREYARAIKSFEKVISWPNSNKQADAYFMLGRSYEALRDTSKARWAYEELLKRFPQSERRALARQKLQQLQPRTQLSAPREQPKPAPTI